ncbi:MAG TPA: hypothetical protein VGS10_13855 [Terracidiphilus sp.]|nr:hypothetical protein [Terracidiphilus sp.]
MVVVPLSKLSDDEGRAVESDSSRETRGSVLRYAAAGSLVASGALFLSGCRRTGLLAALVGTALAMIDQQEAVRVWWNALPVYLDEAQLLLTRVQGAMDDVTAQQQKIRDVFSQATQSAQM